MTRRLLVGYLSLTLLVLLGLEVPFALTYAAEQRQRTARELEREATVLAELAEEAIEQNETEELPDLAAEYAQITGGRVFIYGAQGRLLAASTPALGADPSAAQTDAVRAALAGRRASGVHHSAALGSDVYAITEPATSGTTIRGAVHLAVPSGSLDAAVHRVWATLAAAGLLALAAVAGLGVALARWTIRPVRALEQATDRLASGTLPHPAATNIGPPELRRLATTFNHTATRLQRMIGEQRAFAADASHQLRTPLTALRLRLENLEPDLTTGGQPNLAAALAEIDRLTQMTEQLLALARIDGDDLAPVPVDLDAIIADRAATWTPLAEQKHVQIKATGEPAGTVIALPGAAEQILDNLIANALRVSPEGATIRLHRHRHRRDSPANPTVTLHVIDQGPGMSPQQRARALDRFWRAPDAPKGGAGLGLAIVAKLVQASGGRISLSDNPTGGLDAAITFCPKTHSVAPAPRRRSRPRARHTWTPLTARRTTPHGHRP